MRHSYSYQNRRPMQDEVKVAVIADQMRVDPAAENLDRLLALAAIATALVTLWLLH